MNVERQIRQFVVANLMYGVENTVVARDASLMDAGILDSTGVLELVMFVGETFGVDVPIEDVVPENFDSIAGLARYVSQRLPPASTPVREPAPQPAVLVATAPSEHV